MKQRHLIRKSAAVFTAAALGLSAAPVSVWAEDDYKTQAKDSLAGFAKDIAKQYESSMSAVDTNADSFGVKMNLGLSIDPSVAPMLSSLAGMDMSWLSKISIVADEKFQDNALGIKYDIQLNDTEICPVNVYMDMTTTDVYMNIPTISDGYIYGGNELLAGEFEEDMDIDTGEDSLILPENFSMSEYMQTMPSAADIEDFLNRYGSILIDKADEVKP